MVAERVGVFYSKLQDLQRFLIVPHLWPNIEAEHSYQALIKLRMKLITNNDRFLFLP